jgi:tetratricopeptide (TPR) repeat protein
MDALERGIDAAARGDLQVAIQAYTEAIEAKDRLALAYRHRGHSYVKIGEWDEAITDLTEAINLDHSVANPYAGRGYAFARIGDYLSAISDFTEALRINPRLADVYLYRGDTYLRMGEWDDWDKAVADFTRAIEVARDSPHFASQGFEWRGYVFWATGDLEKAMADLTEAIRLDPKNGSAFYYRALTHERMGKRRNAEDDFANAKRLGYEGEDE